MKTAKRVNLINEKINAQAEDLADLPVTDEQAEQAKGGGSGLWGGAGSEAYLATSSRWD